MDDRDLASMRREYRAGGLLEADALDDPIEQFRRWFEQARDAEVFEPNAMTLATVDALGRPVARTVLLKGIEARGLSFYTNLGSDKSRQLAVSPRAALVFWWGPIARQVRFEGEVERVSDGEADAYFATRPRGSQIGAWTSPQSQPIEARRALEVTSWELDQRFDGDAVPRPPFWGGFRLMPDRVEFWQGQENRLHDRLRYTREPAGGWRIERLAP